MDLDETVYTTRLHHEMNMWNHKQDQSRSPHKFIRTKAALISSPFITEQEELIKFKKEQRYSRDDKEITKKDLQAYLKRLQELKNEAYKQIHHPCTGCPNDKPTSAFEFLEEPLNEQISPEAVCANGTSYHQTDVKAVMIFD